MIPAPLLEKRCSWRVLTLVLTLTLSWQVSHVQCAEADLEAGHPFVDNFAPREYRADSQIWSATQDTEGILYFGNKGIVLEYDGVTWQKIFVSDDNYVIRGLAVDPVSHAVFVGGLNNLGVLKTAPDGAKVFVSLLDHLPAVDRNFGSIYRVYAAPEGIFFVAAKQVMRWGDGVFMVWKFQIADRLQSEYVAGSLDVQSPGLGLQRLTGDRFAPESNDPFFRSATLSGIALGPGGSLVIGTQHDGLFTLRDGVLSPLASDLAAFFKKNEVRHLLRLRGGSLAVATGTAGIVLLDAENRFQDRWDEASGLQNQTALDLFEDREGGVWLCLYVGITRVQTGSPLSVFDASNGLKRTSIHNVRRYHGTIYVATDSGLYRLVKSAPSLGTTARFERVPGLDADLWALCATAQGLLVTGLGTIYQLDDGGTTTLIDKFPYSGACMTPSLRSPGRVFFGTRTELRSLRFDQTSGRWLDEGAVPGVAAEIHSFAETAGGDLWVGSNDHGLFRVRFAPDDATGQRGAAAVTTFLGQPGPLTDVVEVWVSLASDGGVVACTRRGLSRFDAATGNFRLTDVYGTQFADGSFGVDRFAPALPQGVWLTGRSTASPWLDQQGGWAKAGQKDGSGSEFKYFPHEIFDKLNVLDSLFPDESGILWMASPEGIVRLDSRVWLRRDAEPAAFATLIRRATATARTVAAGAAAHAASLALPAAGAPLDWAHNSVQFELAANTYAPGADLLYRTRLGGFGAGQWSPANARSRFEYTNLSSGNYVFEARAQNADGQLGGVATLPFRILPPWQRTPWAYAAYALAAAVAIAAFVAWRGRHLHRRNAALEALVDTRTSELRGREADLLAKEDALVRARDDAEGANRAKSAFLANMSHELRTPLNAILGYSQILVKNSDLPARSREQITVIGQSGNHLLAMINEVLDLSKVEAGKLTLVPSDFFLDPLLEDVSATFRPRLAEKNLKFRQTCAPGLPPLMHADVSRLRQVLYNLLSNAVKFTRAGIVTLEVKPVEDGRVRFEVTDSGAGIAADQLQAIFIAFHQSGESALAAQGTGLGLAISQRLVGLMGGQIQVESALGHGSRFWFDLPLISGSASRGFSEGAPSEEHGVATGYRGVAKRLLIVDDQLENRRVLRDLLQPLGFEIEEAASGAQCLERCANRLPDALLLDLRLGQPDGFEVARTLRLQPPQTRLGIIAVSASVFESDRERAIEAGCDDFLPKPFEELQLLAVLGRVMGLEWIRAGGAASPASANAAAPGEAAPLPTEIDALLELSLRGDIVGLRHRLDALHAADAPAGSGRLVRVLDPLVANFQMDQLHEQLLQFKAAHANN